MVVVGAAGIVVVAAAGIVVVAAAGIVVVAAAGIVVVAVVVVHQPGNVSSLESSMEVIKKTK
jgi:hypothetical protein